MLNLIWDLFKTQRWIHYFKSRPLDIITTWGFWDNLIELASPEDYKEEMKKWSMKNSPILPDGL